jgi:low affinity Fe/Cu permease
MENLSSISPMTWIIILAAALIGAFVLFNKAVKLTLKLAVIVVMVLFVVYFLIQAGLVEPPPLGN